MTDALAFLYSLRRFGAKPGLANTFKLAELAGNPQNRLRFIHVAGTNGKGSTCAMLESIYRAAGLRVGLFTSPHLVRFGERIQVNRQLLPDEDTVRLVAFMKELCHQGWGPLSDSAHSPSTVHPPGAVAQHPTFFEVVTVMALRYFAEQRCDLVIWETGLGGRLDSTNIVLPLASVITNIQHDHEEWLGHSLAEIAAEKAGIIKPGVLVLTATDAPEALAVIESKARSSHAPLTIVGPPDASREPLRTLALPLLGEHQKLNAALATATVRALSQSIPVSDEALCYGLAHVHWPGRLQLVALPDGRELLLDGAHNPAGATILERALEQNFPRAHPSLILGILTDKNWREMCQLLAPRAARIFTVPVASERSADPDELAEACRSANPHAQVQSLSSLRAALELTAAEPLTVLAGSLYLVGEAIELLGLSTAGATERALNEWTATK